MESAGGEETRPRPLLLLLLLASLLLQPSNAIGVTRREAAVGGEEGLLELSQAVAQLTQRFATLEVSIESRLFRLSETATKGEMLIESLSSRLSKVDSLVEKVEALDSRLTVETSSLRSTISNTNRDLQGMAEQLERLDPVEQSRHDTRSSWDERSSSAASADLFIATVTRRITEYVESSLPQLLEHSLTSLHNALYSRISKSVVGLQQEVRVTREELEDLGTQTLEVAAEALQDIQDGRKRTQEAVQDINARIESVRQDLSGKIESTPVLGSLQPVLQQVNHSVVQSFAKATAGFNASLFGEAARVRGGSTGAGGGALFGRQPYQVLDCADPATVEALIEVKYLIKSLLKKSEDLRRGLTQQARDGVELLKLLNQRFLFLLRYLSTETNHGQILVSEMQDLENLVESSYTAILVAQNAFIDSCKRIQIEEPTLELKITEILDKLVTNIDLGQEFNRQQLTELRQVVERLGGDTASPPTGNASATTPFGAPTLTLQEVEDTGVRGDQGRPREASAVLQELMVNAMRVANMTVMRLEGVEERVEEVSADLLRTDWSDLRQKEPADRLVTAAKDLKGFAHDQIVQSLSLHETLSSVLRRMVATPNGTEGGAEGQMRDAGGSSVRLLPSCAAALLQQVRDMPALLLRPPTTPLPEGEEGGGEEKEEEEEEEEEVEEEEEEEEEEHIPAWYTDPDFLSGNYGTPDRGFPVFREEEWVDMDEDYAGDDHFLAKTDGGRVGGGGIDRYFGVDKKRKKEDRPSTRKLPPARTGDFP